MKAHQGRLAPADLSRELKVVLRLGTRPAKLVASLSEIPGLLEVSDLDDDWNNDKWVAAIHVCEVIAAAIRALGDGPYGNAASLVFGIDSRTRGLLLGRRRLEAAKELQLYEVTTFIRHWEPAILLDIAVSLYGNWLKNQGNTPRFN